MIGMGSWICRKMGIYWDLPPLYIIVWQLMSCSLTWDFYRFMILRLLCFLANVWNWDEKGRVGWLNEWWSWLNRENVPPWFFTTAPQKKDGNQLGWKWSSEPQPLAEASWKSRQLTSISHVLSSIFKIHMLYRNWLDFASLLILLSHRHVPVHLIFLVAPR